MKKMLLFRLPLWVLALALPFVGYASGRNIVAWGLMTNVPPTITNVLAIAQGVHHGLALLDDSTVVAWGEDLYGPTNVPADLDQVIAIAAGDDHNLALKADGTVVAWGLSPALSYVPPEATNVIAVSCWGEDLALRADGTVVVWNTNIPNALPPLGLNGVVAVSAGASHSLALKNDGTVVAWGADYSYQTDVPVGLSNVVAISAGYTHSVALCSNGTVVAWGQSYYGYNGPVQPPDGLSGVTQVSAGGSYSGDHSLALKSDGTVVAWGYNYNGQTNVPAGLANAIAVSAKGFTSMALVDDGSYNSQRPRFLRQPANQTTLIGGAARFSAEVTGPSPISYQWQFNGTNIDAAVSSSLNLVNVQLQNAGTYSVVISNAYGSRVSRGAILGVAETLPFAWGGNFSHQTNVPDGVIDVIQVAGGYQHSLALKKDGTVVGWGETTFGETNFVPGLSNVLSIGAGVDFSVALTRSNTVLACGNTFYGQSQPPPMTGIVAISAGAYHALALDNAGNVFAWGAGTHDNSYPNYHQNLVPAGLSNVVAIAAGNTHSLALKADGHVVGWGSAGFGESSSPAGLSNVVAIAAGDYYSMALKSDGRVVLWGNAPSPPPGLSNVVAIAAGIDHCLGLKRDGTLVAWGSEDFPAAGSGQASVPPGLPPILSISAGQYHNVIVVGTHPPLLQASMNNVRGLGGNPFTFDLFTQAGHVYTLEAKESFSDAEWKILQRFAGTGGTTTFTDKYYMFSPQRFYRVRQW